MQPDWKRALIEACQRGQWQKASVLAAEVNLDKDGWKQAAAYIEGEKAKALARLTAAWRARQ